MDIYKITFETWNKVASLYQERFMDLSLYNDSYDIFCQLIDKRNPDILEIGCGPGNITKYILSARPDFKILAIDVAPNMIELAKLNIPTVDFRVMDCRNINTIDGKFDGIICGFCIPYLSMEDTYKLIEAISHLLNKNGLLYFSTIKGDYSQSGFEVASTGDSTYVYYYNEEDFQNELVKNGFTLVNLTQKDFPKSDGTYEINQVFISGFAGFKDEIQLKFDEINYTFPLVFVQGTGANRFCFGLENDQLKVKTKDFFISKYPVTQILWKHIMGNNPAHSADNNKPVETVSYNDISSRHGFLQKINTKALQDEITKQIGQAHPVKFRLPTETEWEYAARGGIHWGDYFIYSGSDNIEEVGWYRHNSNNESKVVGQKKSNQLGIYDMCGNLWEWCLDYFQRDTSKIPLDGTPCLEESANRVLRGGCFHNFGIHCTVMKRYEINPEHKDPCIGFRIAFSI